MDTGEELQSATITNKTKKEKYIWVFSSFDFYPLGRKVRQCSPHPPFLSPSLPLSRRDCENMSILNSIFPIKISGE